MSFAELYDLHGQPVFRFLYARTRNLELAEDFTQDVFAWALARPPGDRLEDKLFRDQRSHLLTRARSALIDHWRKEARQPAVAIDDEDEFAAPLRAENLGVLEAMARLPEDRREILELRYLGGLSFEEIATILGCKPKTANERFRVARNELLRSLRAASIVPSIRSGPPVGSTGHSLQEGRLNHEL